MRLSARELYKQLQSGKFFSSYLIYGHDVTEVVNYLRDCAKQQNYDINYKSLIIEANFNWAKFNYYTNNGSLFTKKCLIELQLSTAKVLDNKIASKTLIEYINHPAKDVLLIIIINNVLDWRVKNSTWFMALDRIGGIIFTRKQRNNISYQDTTNDNQVLLNDWLVAALLGNAKQIIEITHKLRDINTEPILANWLIYQEIRLLIKIQFMVRTGMQLEDAISAQKLTVNRKVLLKAALSRLNLEQLHKSLLGCVQIDKVIKGIVTYGTPWDMLLDNILQLAGINLFSISSKL